jgi:hypothetical protein
MVAGPSFRRVFVDSPSSLGARLREKRQQMLSDAFPSLEEMRVLDLGGTPDTWLRARVRPAAVTLLNSVTSELDLPQSSGRSVDFELVIGDACDPPPELRERSFDLVFSNSVIEHVGGIYRRQQFADYVAAAAPRYWIQTPYRYFPLEPHWLFPGFQFLPLNVRAALSRTWPLMHTRSTTREGSIDTALDVELIGLTELRHLFPDAAIHKERVFGLVKSIIAVRPE